MNSMAANDGDGTRDMSPCMVDMSVLDLAIFMRVHRAQRPVDAGAVSLTVSHWFACRVDPATSSSRSIGCWVRAGFANAGGASPIPSPVARMRGSIFAGLSG